MAEDYKDLETSESQLAESPAVDSTFEKLGLAPEIISALTEMGFENPTEVQAKTIPHALNGKDLLVQSRTGTGKTAAFAIPFGQSLDGNRAELQALALAPTRELAIQVAKESARILANTDIQIVAVYGGAAMGPQVAALQKGAQIVVGTPGRVLDHIKRGTMKTRSVRMLVLDECDEMLSMGFQEELMSIVSQLPKERQTLLFSATIPEEIQRLGESYLTEPEFLQLSEDYVGVREIQHAYYLVSGGDRTKDLLQVLEYENPQLALIFCNTREETSYVAEFLRKQGFKAEGISSDLTQREREKVMGKMRAGELRFLVATGVAARGIDISDLTHVINYTFPESADVYIHRTGRTGRAGKGGAAISLVSPKEIGSFYYLKLTHKIYPEERRLPSQDEMETRREAENLEALKERVGANGQASKQMRALARRVISSVDGLDVVACALEVLLSENTSGSDSIGRSERNETHRNASRGSSSRSARPDRVKEFRGESRRGRKTERPHSRNREDNKFTTADGEIENYVVMDGSGSRSQVTRDDEEVRLFFDVGKRKGLNTSEMLKYLKDQGELDAEQIGRIQVLDQYSFVNVAANVADRVIGKLNGKSFLEQPLRVEKARSR
ncbi:MAG: DEAD/DEAH box helicase [Pseudomonadota bacterium]